jgi:hypothetical protein
MHNINITKGGTLMDNGTGITPVMPIGGYGCGDGFGGNSFMWIFGLLILMGMFNGGFGGWGNNGFANALGYENLATSNEVQRGFDAQNSMANEREILAAVNNGTAQAVAATNQTFHDTLGIVQNRYDELARDISGIAVAQAQAVANQNECCCSTKMLIQQTAADNALRMSQMEARLNAKMDANRIDELQQQVNQLQLQQATNGVLRFPNSWSYGAGPFPPIYGCCGNNI